MVPVGSITFPYWELSTTTGSLFEGPSFSLQAFSLPKRYSHMTGAVSHSTPSFLRRVRIIAEDISSTRAQPSCICPHLSSHHAIFPNYLQAPLSGNPETLLATPSPGTARRNSSILAPGPSQNPGSRTRGCRFLPSPFRASRVILLARPYLPSSPPLPSRAKTIPDTLIKIGSPLPPPHPNPLPQAPAPPQPPFHPHLPQRLHLLPHHQPLPSP